MHKPRRASQPLRRLALALLLLAPIALLLTLALPVRTWRSGETPLPPLHPPATAHPPVPTRLWIDTDAACGTGARRDPDDCLALALLLRTDEVQVAGVSTVFGNAPLHVTDRVTRELATRLQAEGGPVAVHTGCGVALADAACRDAPALAALAQALQGAPLTLVALGPLTNVAALLRQQPALAGRIARIVAVMGRRPGHRFHPSASADGRGTTVLLGHGPVFRDFNVVQDRDAVREVLQARVPLTLVPFDVARQVVLSPRDLDRLGARSASLRWVADASRDWLRHWQHDIGVDGFHPFDLVAAAQVLLPARFTCAQVDAWLGRDPLLTVFERAPALLVTQDEPVPKEAQAQARARYCVQTDIKVPELFE